MKEDSSNNEPKPNLSREVFGNKLDLKKIGFTFYHSIINVKSVVQDYYKGEGKYTKPVKYSLSIIAPYVLLMQLLDFSEGEMAYNDGYQSLSNESSGASTNPSAFSENLQEVISTFISVGEEILPIVYALLIIPFFAFWMRVFFKRKKFNFPYYYAAGIYILMTATFITYPLTFLSAYGYETYNVGEVLIALLFVYGCYKLFEDNLVLTTIKSILILALGFASMVIVYTSLILTVTFIKISVF